MDRNVLVPDGRSYLLVKGNNDRGDVHLLCTIRADEDSTVFPLEKPGSLQYVGRVRYDEESSGASRAYAKGKPAIKVSTRSLHGA